MRRVAVAAAALVCCASSGCAGSGGDGSSERALSPGDARTVDRIVEQAMSEARTAGLSLAIARRGRLVFAKAYGRDGTGHALGTGHRLRIASVSKPLTAIAVMRLVERGRLGLDQRVFGDGSLLGDQYGPPSRFADPRVADVTVRQLLEHTAGGWDNDAADGSDDPVFLRPELDRDQHLTWALRTTKLEHAPGTVFQYSNLGYVLLGRVIEQVTGLPYAEAMRRDVFLPAGASSFALAGRTASERLTDEAGYAVVGGRADVPYRVPIERFDAAGGWVATPTDLLRVAVRADGFPTVPDVLGEDALAAMTEPVRQPAPDGTRAFSAKGWAVNDIPNWWHTGSLPGTSSLLVRTADRYGPSGEEELTWAVITNSTNPRHDLDLDALMWRIVNAVKSWPATDLFHP